MFIFLFFFITLGEKSKTKQKNTAAIYVKEYSAYVFL